MVSTSYLVHALHRQRWDLFPKASVRCTTHSSGPVLQLKRSNFINNYNSVRHRSCFVCSFVVGVGVDVGGGGGGGGGGGVSGGGDGGEVHLNSENSDKCFKLPSTVISQKSVHIPWYMQCDYMTAIESHTENKIGISCRESICTSPDICTWFCYDLFCCEYMRTLMPETGISGRDK